MRKVMNIRRAGILLVTILLMLGFAAAMPSPTYAASKLKTKVTGLVKTQKPASVDKKLTDEITVKNAYGRTVKLYHYDAGKKKWILDGSFRTAKKKTATVTLVYSGYWRYQPTTKWKIKISKLKKGKGHKAVKKYSKSITVKNSEAVPLTTGVTGLETFLDPEDTECSLYDSITLKNGGGRAVNLYRYDPTSGKWVLYESFQTEASGDTELTLDYSDEWKKTDFAKWKITVKSRAFDPDRRIKGLTALDETITIHNRYEDKPEKSTLSGVKSEITKTYEETAADTVTVSPAYGRTVDLYLYNETAQKWVKKASFQTENTYYSKVKITYPDQWKAHYVTKWKIVAPIADAANSGNVNPAPEVSADASVYDKYLSCKTAVVMSADTGELIYDMKMNTKRKVASLTKMMTAVLLTENKDLSSKIKITKGAIKEVSPWQYGFKAGDSMTAKNALYAMMLVSSNETASSVGRDISGSTADFAAKMNQRAKALGMKSTVYKNAHGLDVGKSHSTGNYSTAYDQALLARYIMTSAAAADIRSAMKTGKKTIKTTDGRSYTLYTTNELLGENGCVGMKTGTEDLAGYCFAGAFQYDGKTYVTVVLGAGTESARWKNTKALYRYLKYALKNHIEAW